MKMNRGVQYTQLGQKALKIQGFEQMADMKRRGPLHGPEGQAERLCDHIQKQTKLERLLNYGKK